MLVNRHVNAIAGRLSLRPPQRRSLEILHRITEIAPPGKGADVATQLATIRSEFPSVTDFERDFPSLCFALATGVGKTRLMGAFGSYLHLAHGIDNFFVLAPNLTIYNKLIADFSDRNHPKYVFRGIAEFAIDAPSIITGDNYDQHDPRSGTLFGGVRINIFNISKINSEVRGGKSPRIKRLSEYIGQSYFDYLAGLPDLVLIMDESHRYRASAGVRAINELKPILGLELTATPFVETSRGPVQFKNVAAVMVTAQLPAFAQPGQMIDVTVSSMGNAKSLRGGTLIATPLKGLDGQIYALAQGNLLVGGAGAAAGGSKVQINHLSAGRIPGGAQIERAVATPFALGETIDLGLDASDFQTALRVTDAINKKLGNGTANAVDGRVIRLRAPADPNARVGFLAAVEEVRLDAPVPVAKVIINSRTGSIVMNQAVTLAACAVSHGNLSVSISSTPVISQPNPLSPGAQTVVTEKADIRISQDGGSLIEVPAAAKLSDVVRALNALGATPQDLLAILQAIKASGALNAELEVI